MNEAMPAAHENRSANGGKLHHHKTLLAIAIFKWCKGVLLILLAFGLFKLLHHDVGAMLESLANKLRVDPENRYLGEALAKLHLLDDGKLEKLSGITFAYGVLLLTEGTGLYFEKRWAELLTVIATGCFIPLELYELFVSVSPVKCLLLLMNVGIVMILIVTLRRQAAKPDLEEAGRRDTVS
ncbi:MAG: DUF2127 domain-containing protein [Luteolibacter sp.]